MDHFQSSPKWLFLGYAESRNGKSLFAGFYIDAEVVTLNDGKQDDYDEEEEGDVEQDAPDLKSDLESHVVAFIFKSKKAFISLYLVGVAIWGLDLVSDASACPDALVQVEHEALKEDIINVFHSSIVRNPYPSCLSFILSMCPKPKLAHREHVVTLLVDFLLLLGDVELPEEVERDDGVDVDDDGEQSDREHELLAVVRDGLEDDAEGGDPDGDVDEVCREEEVVVVAEDGEDKVPQQVQEGLEC